MTKTRITTAVAALLLTTAPLAFAQTAGTGHEPTAPATRHESTAAAPAGVHESTSAAPARVSETIQPDQIRASKMLGSTVYDVQNRDIGKIDDLVLDRDGKVAAVVVQLGGFLGMGGKDVAVRMSDIKTDNNRLTLDMSKEKLQQANNYDLENKNTGAGSSASPVHGGHLGSAAGSDTAPVRH